MNVGKQIQELFESGEISKEAAFKAAMFKDDLIKFAFPVTKAAPYFSPGKRIIESLLLGTGISLAGVGVNKAYSAYEASRINSKKDTMYEAMLRETPELLNEDTTKVKKYFMTLVRFAPSFAEDPVAAGAYLKRIIQFDPEGGASYDTIRTIVQLEKDLQDTRGQRTKIHTDLSSNVLGNVAKSTSDAMLSGRIYEDYTQPGDSK